MAYTHIQYEVDMIQNRSASSLVAVTGGLFGVMPSGANPSLVGVAIWTPVFMPHRIVGVGLYPYVCPTQLAAVSNQPNFWFAQCVTVGSATVSPAASNIFAKLTLPTTVTGGAACPNRSLYHFVTAQTAGGGAVIIKPGQVVKVHMPCGDVGGGGNTGQYLFKLLVEPVWGTPQSITVTPSTGTSTTLAMIDIKQPTGYDGVA